MQTLSKEEMKEILGGVRQDYGQVNTGNRHHQQY